PEDVRSNDVALVLAGRRQRPDPGDITDCPEPIAGPKAGVDGDARPACVDADRLEPDAVHARMAAGRDEKSLTPQLEPVVEGDDEVAAVPAHFPGAHPEQQLDAVTPQDLCECSAQR